MTFHIARLMFYFLHISKDICILSCDFSTFLQIGNSSLQLAISQCSLKIGKSIIVAKFLHFVIPATIILAHFCRIFGNSVCSVQSRFTRQFRIVCGNHSAFATSNMLHRMKGKYGHLSQIPISTLVLFSFRIIVKSTWSMASIFDYP